MNPGIMLTLIVLVDYHIGDPNNWPHPIIFIGKLISFLEKILRRIPISGYLTGGLLWLFSVSLVGLFFYWVEAFSQRLHPMFYYGLVLYFGFAALAATCLKKEAMNVMKVLEEQGILEGRKAIGYLVGRDTADLSQEAIITADIETVAENTIDGVIAPLFFLILGFYFGHPLVWVYIYKTINTLDSMVGYVQEPYRKIGYVSAKMDDLANWLPARVGSFLMILSVGFILPQGLKGARETYKKDRKAHKSPNAGHPEAVIAGALGLQFGGNHHYFGRILEKPTIGVATRQAKAEDVLTTTKIMYMAEFMLLIGGIIGLMLLT